MGPSKDPLPASSTPQMMLLLPVNSNPLIPNQDIVGILSLPQQSWYISSQELPYNLRGCNMMLQGSKKVKQFF
jgi:hypothetical protein